MGLYRFHLPDVGEGVAEAEIVVWHVKVGDSVKEDQSLVDVMTDKATVDMTSPVDGLVTAVRGDVGTMVAVGSVLVELEVAGAGSGATDATCTVLPSSPEPAPAVTDPLPPAAEPPTIASPAAGLPPAAAPSTRRRAKQAGIDLRDIPGSGPAGRITSYDLDAFIARPAGPTSTPTAAPTAAVFPEPARATPSEGVTQTRIVGMRRKIAEKMQDAKRRIPHIAYVEEVDVTELEALRADLNADRDRDRPKLTLLPFLICALVRAVPDFPNINARYDDEEGVLHAFEAVHVGIATQTPGGLMVPVVRHAEMRDLWALASEIARLSATARDGSARREELSASTITLTSLGALGGVVTTPIINYPEVAIVAPNKIVERPVVAGHFVTVRKMMNLSSSFDHRIVDGYDAARFIQRLKRLLEHPALIFMAA